MISIHLDGQDNRVPVAPRGGGPAPTAAEPTIELGVSDVVGLRPGDDIFVYMTVLADGSASFSFYDYQRATPMWVLTIAFVAAVLVLGRSRGLGALAGLILSTLFVAWSHLTGLSRRERPVSHLSGCER